MKFNNDMWRLIIQNANEKSCAKIADFQRLTDLAQTSAKRIWNNDSIKFIDDDNAEKICKALNIDFQAFWMKSWISL